MTRPEYFDETDGRFSVVSLYLLYGCNHAFIEQLLLKDINRIFNLY